MGTEYLGSSLDALFVAEGSIFECYIVGTV